MRNWLQSLSPASFKGVPFWIENDKEEGGRRLVVHEFPNRDEPFIEDLGESKRNFHVTAYVASDGAVSEAAALVSVCTTRGAGPLVRHLGGSAQVHCDEIKRTFEKDKLGKLAFELKFVRDGAASALPSIGQMLSQAFAAAEALAPAVGAMVEQAVETFAQPEHVVDAAVDGMQVGAATLEALRTDLTLDPVQSPVIRAALQDLYDAAPTMFSSSVNPTGTGAETLVTLALDLAEAAKLPDEAASVFRSVLDEPALDPPNRFGAVTRTIANANAKAMNRALRLAAAAAMCDAYLRRTYSNRRAGISARAEIAEYLEVELHGCQGEADAGLFIALGNLRGRVVDYLSALIVDLAPVVTVEAAKSMPAVWWGWRMYQDPNRDLELAARNGVPDPAFMPATFEALAR